MIRFLLEACLQVLPVAIIATLLVRERRARHYRNIGLAATIFIAYQMVLILPRFIRAMDFIASDWNWEGKIAGIIFGLLCYFLFRHRFREHDFFTLRQYKPHFPKTLLVSGIVVAVITVIYFFMGSTPFDGETLAFQLIMPALDEELLFRCVLLGLLTTALRDKIGFLGSPSVLLTALLFGFMHALTLDKGYHISFDPIYFLHTGIGGYVFGWVTLQSRSLLLAILTHGLANFLAALAMMIR